MYKASAALSFPPPMPSRLNRSAADTDGNATDAAIRNETRTVTPPAMRPSTAAEPGECADGDDLGVG